MWIIWDISGWARDYICKHVISISKTAGCFQYIPAIDIAIESKNKRDRKRLEKASTALTRQTSNLFL